MQATLGYMFSAWYNVISTEELINAVKRVIAGGKYISPTLAERLARIGDLDGWLASIPPEPDAASASEVGAPSIDDSQLRQQLESLGYIQ